MVPPPLHTGPSVPASTVAYTTLSAPTTSSPPPPPLLTRACPRIRCPPNPDSPNVPYGATPINDFLATQASTCIPGRVQLSKEAYAALSPEKRLATEIRRGVSMKGKGSVDTYLVLFEPDGMGLRLWRNYRRFEKMTKVRGTPITSFVHEKSCSSTTHKDGKTPHLSKCSLP